MKTYDYSNYSDSELGRQLYDYNQIRQEDGRFMGNTAFNRLQAKINAIQAEQNKRKN